MLDWSQFTSHTPYLVEITSFLWWFFSKFLYDKYEEMKWEKDEAKNFDKTLFLKLQDTMISKNSMKFWRDWNPNCCFETKEMSQLIKFVDCDSDNPDLKFIDKRWEKLKVQLFQDLENLYQTIIIETFPHKNKEWYQWVPSEWEQLQPERYLDVIKTLSAQSAITWGAYEKFLAYWRNRFKA